MSTPRAKNLEVENENLRNPTDDGAPRPATEPAGSKQSARTTKTETDPGSGEQT